MPMVSFVREVPRRRPGARARAARAAPTRRAPRVPRPSRPGRGARARCGRAASRTARAPRASRARPRRRPARRRARRGDRLRARRAWRRSATRPGPGTSANSTVGRARGGEVPVDEHDPVAVEAEVVVAQVAVDQRRRRRGRRAARRRAERDRARAPAPRRRRRRARRSANASQPCSNCLGSRSGPGRSASATAGERHAEAIAQPRGAVRARGRGTSRAARRPRRGCGGSARASGARPRPSRCCVDVVHGDPGGVLGPLDGDDAVLDRRRASRRRPLPPPAVPCARRRRWRARASRRPARCASGRTRSRPRGWRAAAPRPSCRRARAGRRSRSPSRARSAGGGGAPSGAPGPPDGRAAALQSSPIRPSGAVRTYHRRRSVPPAPAHSNVRARPVGHSCATQARISPGPGLARCATTASAPSIRRRPASLLVRSTASSVRRSRTRRPRPPLDRVPQQARRGRSPCAQPPCTAGGRRERAVEPGDRRRARAPGRCGGAASDSW